MDAKQAFELVKIYARKASRTAQESVLYEAALCVLLDEIGAQRGSRGSETADNPCPDCGRAWHGTSECKKPKVILCKPTEVETAKRVLAASENGAEQIVRPSDPPESSSSPAADKTIVEEDRFKLPSLAKMKRDNSAESG